MTQSKVSPDFKINTTADMNYVTGHKLSNNFNAGFKPSAETISRAKAGAAVADLRRMMG